MAHFSGVYNLEERTARFSEAVLALCNTVPRNAVTKSIITQCVRSSTSIGANYREANGASSKKDFRNKIYICKKEAQETKYWLRMLVSLAPAYQDKIRKLQLEAHALTLIFQKITKTLDAQTDSKK